MSKKYFELAVQEAKKATCLRAKCGSVIISEDDKVIGKGFNAPPLKDEKHRFCSSELDLSKKPKYDKTCCVHAEWNAILDAIAKHPDKIEGSTLYFMRIDKDGNFTDAGEPFCTVCSRLALQSGITHFSLWNDGEDCYSTSDYNLKSYEFYK